MSGPWPKPLSDENREPVKHCAMQGLHRVWLVELPSLFLQTAQVVRSRNLSSSQGVIENVLEPLGKVRKPVCSRECLMLRSELWL